MSKPAQGEEEAARVDSRTALRHVGRVLGILGESGSGLAYLLVTCVICALLVTTIEVALPQLMALGVDVFLTSTATPKSLPWTTHWLIELFRLPDPSRGVLSPQLKSEGLGQLSAAYVILLVASSALSFGITLGLSHIGQRVVQRVRLLVFGKLHRLPIRYFDSNPVGRIVTRVANDTGTFSDLFTGVIANLLNSLLKLLVVWLALWWVSPRLTGLIMILLPPAAILTVWFQNQSKEVQRQSRIRLAKINAFLQESLQGLAVIKAFTAEPEMERRFQERNLDYTTTENKMVFLYAVFRPVYATCSILTLGILILVGGQSVLAGQLTLGSLVAYILYLKMLFAPLDNLAEKFNVFQGAAVAAERIFEILDAPEEVTGSIRSVEPSVDPVIAFDCVEFSYTPDKQVLKGVSFQVLRGQKVAVVGATGSGKSTLVNLLLGFYPLKDETVAHNRGQIRLWGRDLSDYQLSDLRRHFGYVQQDLFLFHADLAHNVKLHREIAEPTFQEALRISRAQLVLERIRLEGPTVSENKSKTSLPNIDQSSSPSQLLPTNPPSGPDIDLAERPLGERGLQLSQGERQLLSFARALVESPEIVILDEATASIDSFTESLIQEAMNSVLAGRTALIIAHRLSTIEHCDQILVMQEGQILERGTHQELLAAQGVYARLIHESQN